jgi:hypothetical protein
MSAESENGDLQFALDHWIGVADTLKQQRDQAEKERDALRKDADIVRRARARSSLVIEVTPELLTKDAFTDQPLHVMLTDNGDGTHLLTFRESDELHTLRAERDAMRNYVEEKLNIAKLSRLRGEELDRYISALVNAEARAETAEAERDALLKQREGFRRMVNASRGAQP